MFVIACEYTRSAGGAKYHNGLLRKKGIYSSFLSFFSSRALTILLTSWARSRGQISKCIRRFNHDEVMYADGGDEFIGTPKEIACGVECMAVAGKDIFVSLPCDKFVYGGPGADVAPTNLRGNHENAAGAFFTRGALQNSKVHRNIFELSVDSL